MHNIFKYIKTYGNLTFEQKEITDIDVLIFSQIPYLNFSNSFTSKNHGIKLSELWNKAIKDNINSNSIASKNAFKIMEMLSIQKRYKDLILKNYIYYLAEDTQFGAITIEIPNNCIYVAFEGTDGTLWGWKEDFELTYIYPTNSQKLAANYLDNTIKIFGPNVIVCGHSKGGNLALVGSMNTNILKRNKIKKIYSFDGPGLKEEEFTSSNYKSIRNKLVNIIPNLSLVGVLLNQENTTVIKSVGLGILQHDPTTWIINNDSFKHVNQDKLSKKLDRSINNWLTKYNYQEREEIIKSVFNIFKNANIENINDIKINKLESIYKIIKSSKEMSKETKDIIKTSIKLLAIDFKEEIMTKENK